MKHFIFTVLLLGGLSFFAFAEFEPAVSMAASDYATSTVSLTVSSEISLTGCSDISMSPSIDLSQDSSIGSTVCSVETNNWAGYTLDVKATGTPAMQRVGGGDSFDDFATTSMPSTWNEVGASEKKFGFTVYGSDVSTSVWGSGASCGTAGADAVTNASMNYYGFYTSATTTTSSASPTDGDGTDTIICVAAEQGDSTNAQSGDYKAVIVVTATTQ